MARPVRVLELRSVRGTGGGPEKTILLGAARTDPARYAVTVCYIRDARDGVFFVHDLATALPVDYVELRERHSFDPAIWPALRRLVRDRGIDIVHAHDYKTDLLAWLVGKTQGVATLATVHGWTGRTLRERFYYRFDKRLLARFERAVAVSRDIESELLRAGAARERLAVVLNGIDHRAFRRVPSRTPACRAMLGIAPGDIVIGAVGRLERQKRFDVLIDAVAALRPAHPSLRLVIAGDGSLRQTLQDRADRTGLGSACLLIGHTTDVTRVHHAFDLFVQASDYEGTPNAVLEAMALETPVVATDAGGTEELVRHEVDGLIVPAGSPQAIVDAVARTLADPAATALRTASARRRVETELSFETRMATIEAIYDDLARKRRRAEAAAVVPA
jgi:glycosyltransferase involved in cell wall biosynthesis